MANKVTPKPYPESHHIDNRKILGEFIRAQRTHQNLDISTTAQMLGISVDLLSQLENGNRNVQIDSLLPILHGLGLQMGVFTKKDMLIAEHDLRELRHL
mgnify:CR=1 FL=1